MKITVLDGHALNPGDLSWEDLAQLGQLVVYQRTDPADILTRAQDSEIVITNKTVLDAQTIASLPKLKYIGVLATGYNVIDVEEAHKRGIIVTNIPSYSTMSVAQRVFALLLTVTDRTEHYAIENRKGAWTNSVDFCWWDTSLTELASKKFGIIGMGNIGKAVAKIALAFDMEVLAYSSKKESELPIGVRKVSLNELYRDSDIISLHCPLTPATKDLINKDSISRMKDGVILINTGRGPLINEKDVAEALESGKIKAFCADVLSTEPPVSDNPLLTSPNSYITPHTAWATKEARTRLMNIAVSNVASFLTGSPQNVV
ncbi:MAG: D-2-hydroxyacid dehydrogenase [Muribaculaceae bacterium]|nr:D-2-hydroxyacid dehydrogenase [Muribaculaceae bacterium]